MTLGEKFNSSTEFANYVEKTFGKTLTNSQASEFYNANSLLRFTYTGILRAIAKI